MMVKFMRFVLLLELIEIVSATSKPVSVLDKKIGQLVTSSLLTWEPYDPSMGKHQLEFAVIGGEFLEKYPAYICRSSIDSVAVTGYVKKRSDDSLVCIISQHSQMKTKGDFELLLNKGNGAKVEWTEWGNVLFQHIDGAVSTINGGGIRSEVYYIARHKRNHSMEHHEIDHAIGWFDPSTGFGRIHATVASAEEIFDNGEILITFEPIRYELHDIKFKSLKLKESKNRTLLGQAMLKNEEDKAIDVNAVIGYEYDVVRHTGHCDGIARSINTTVFLKKKEIYDFFWNIEKSDHVVGTKGVGTILQPGTGLNVTLWGNYTTKEGPYDAQLVIHWSDGSKSKKRRITVNAGFEKNLEDQLEIEYSPTFWLYNNTVIPTTTQKATTSTTTTHRSTSIFSTSMSNNLIERITEKSSMNEDDSDEEKSDENEILGTSSSSRIHIESSIISFIIFNLICFVAH